MNIIKRYVKPGYDDWVNHYAKNTETMRDYENDYIDYREQLKQIKEYEKEIERLWNNIRLKISHILDETGKTNRKDDFPQEGLNEE